MAETPAAANVSDSADRISHATYTSVSSAISRAKQAAADVGINTNDLHTHEFSEEYFQGRTSFAFELTGLDSATSIGERRLGTAQWCESPDRLYIEYGVDFRKPWCGYFGTSRHLQTLWY